jgi:hypothetical protein
MREFFLAPVELQLKVKLDVKARAGCGTRMWLVPARATPHATCAATCDICATRGHMRHAAHVAACAGACATRMWRTPARGLPRACAMLRMRE